MRAFGDPVPNTPTIPPVNGTAEELAIYTVDLAKSYRSKTALAGLTMRVPRGEVFGFLGPNGAGKTTSVKLLLGLTAPTGGEGWVLGAPIGNREARRHIGYLPELFRYQAWLSAREVLELHGELAGLPRERRHVDETLALVGLTDRAGDRVGAFSKGMQQRLGLGVALLGEPQLVFLDEPTSALDPVGRRDVREIIHTLKARGATVFLNSHLLTEVEQVCDRVAVVDHGRVIAMGTLHELLSGGGVVRVRLENAAEPARAVLARFGQVKEETNGFVVSGTREGVVPDLVAALVAAGARVCAVEPSAQSLEERFIQLLKGSSDALADHRATHPV